MTAPDIFLSYAGADAKAQFLALREAKPAIALDHYVEYFKTFTLDPTIAAELLAGVVQLRDALAVDEAA